MTHGPLEGIWYWTDITHTAYLAVGLNRYDCVLEGSLIRTYPIKYLELGLFWVMQILGRHGHFGEYDHFLFYRLKNH